MASDDADEHLCEDPNAAELNGEYVGGETPTVDPGEWPDSIDAAGDDDEGSCNPSEDGESDEEPGEESSCSSGDDSEGDDNDGEENEYDGMWADILHDGNEDGIPDELVFDGDLTELTRAWFDVEYVVESFDPVSDNDGESSMDVRVAVQDESVTFDATKEFRVEYPDPEETGDGEEVLRKSAMLTFRGEDDPWRLEINDLKSQLRPFDREMAGDGVASNMPVLFRYFDLLPATRRELQDELIDPDEWWDRARSMYNRQSRARDTPDKEDCRETVIRALEAEAEWMYVTDRSNEQYYDLRRWTWETGWVEDAWQAVGTRVEDELGTLVTKDEKAHIQHHLANRHPIHSDELDAGDDERTLIPFSNGVLVLESVELDDDGHLVSGTSELLPHEPEYRFTSRFEAPWDPENADTDTIDEFMESIVGGPDLTPTTKETDIKTMWEFAGHSFFVAYHPQGFLIIVGEGGDGKTVWFNLVTKVLGEDNVAGAPLDAITNGKFSAAEVVDRKANIAADISGTIQTDIADLKWMTGNDRSRVRPIRKAPFYARNQATMMFGSNDPPAFVEKKRALKRRLYPIRAPFEFHNDPDPDDPHQKQKIPESELMADLTLPEALAAVAVRMVEGAKRLRENDEWTLGLEMSEDERLEFYESEADALGDFTNQCIGVDPHGPGVALDDLEAGYDAFAVENDHPSKERNTIKKEIERSRDIQLKRSYVRSWTDDDERIVVYKGIRFTEEAAQYLPAFAHWDKYDHLENPHATDEEMHPVDEPQSLNSIRDAKRGVFVTTGEVEVTNRKVYHNGIVELTLEDESDVMKLKARPESGGVDEMEYSNVEKLDGIAEGDKVEVERAEKQVSHLMIDDVTTVTHAIEDVSQRQRYRTVRDAVKRMDGDDGADIGTVVAFAAGQTALEMGTIESTVESMLSDGELTEPAEGRVRLT